MDYFFENRYVRTEEVLKEVIKKYFLTNREQLIVSGIVSALQVFVLLSFALSSEGLKSFGFGFVFAFFIFYIAMKILGYKSLISTNKARDYESCNGGLMEVAMYMGAEAFVVTYSTGGQSIIPYSAIGWTGESKNFFILASKKSGQLYLLAKYGFVQGNCEDCRLLLRSKGFKV